MIQLRRSTFVAVLVLTVIGGAALGAFAVDRSDLRRAAAPARLDAPILPVQMPLTTGTFAKVAEAIKPAVVNVNTVSKGVAGGRTPFEEFFGEEFFRRFFGEAPERIPQRSLGSGV
ncbi:MAG: hypothetical protein HY216_14625, partial [Candidatus Rokubacteria bacterium]|nr:hypothetical protein [Candidatus Rokubacteria bacterium]